MKFRSARFSAAGRRRGALAALMLAAITALVIVSPVSAQMIPLPKSYDGDLWTRPALTGNWGGFRDDLAKRGVWLDVGLLQTYQGALGGKKDDNAYWGSADYLLHVDTGKLGLWPGGFLTVFAESSFGSSVNGSTGAISPVNGDAMFPIPESQSTTLTSMYFTQFLHPKFGLFFGKVYTLDGDANEFADNHRTKFMNLSFDFSPTGLRAVPYAGLGGGLVALPWEGAVVTAMVIDPNGKAENNPFDDAFKDGVTVAVEGRFAIKPFGLPGHQLVSLVWGTKDYVALSQDPRSLLRNFVARELVQRFPRLGVVIQPAEFQDLLRRKSDTWAVTYNFDQYLWTRGSNAEEGIGLFFRFGASDGDPNPIKWFYSGGIGGKGLVPTRPRDTWGIGLARTEISDNFLPRIRTRFNLGLNREDVVEAYYNAALTNWLNLTADIQYINPAIGKTLEPGPRFKNLDESVVLGLRLYAKF